MEAFTDTLPLLCMGSKVKNATISTKNECLHWAYASWIKACSTTWKNPKWLKKKGAWLKFLLPVSPTCHYVQPLWSNKTEIQGKITHRLIVPKARWCSGPWFCLKYVWVLWKGLPGTRCFSMRHFTILVSKMLRFNSAENVPMSISVPIRMHVCTQWHFDQIVCGGLMRQRARSDNIIYYCLPARSEPTVLIPYVALWLVVAELYNRGTRLVWTQRTLAPTTRPRPHLSLSVLFRMSA